jgi:hypothetical protein
LKRFIDYYSRTFSWWHRFKTLQNKLASETNDTLNATTHQWKRQLAAEAAAEAARVSVTEKLLTNAN